MFYVIFKSPNGTQLWSGPYKNREQADIWADCKGGTVVTDLPL